MTTKEEKKENSSASPPAQAQGAPCSNCGNPSLVSRKIEAGMRLSLQKENISDIPVDCCDVCYRGFERLVSKGAKLRAEQVAAEQQRLVLWRSRMNLVRQARDLMEKKLFSDAAIVYEKYLKVLQIVYRVKAEEITPDLFKGRPSEITVLASVYWDLLRIYDANPRYKDRQWAAAEKLLSFAKFSPIFPNILRNAEIAYRSAKNPQPYRHFLKKSSAGGGRCFVANAAFGGPHHPEVILLCRFRDRVLEGSPSGRKLVAIYYTHGPALAKKLEGRPGLKGPTRTALRWAAKGLSKFFNLNP